MSGMLATAMIPQGKRKEKAPSAVTMPASRTRAAVTGPGRPRFTRRQRSEMVRNALENHLGHRLRDGRPHSRREIRIDQSFERAAARFLVRPLRVPIPNLVRA